MKRISKSIRLAWLGKLMPLGIGAVLGYGAGYEFLKAMVAKIDRFNPQIATRMAAPFTQWRRYDADRQQGMRAQLEELLQAADISDDLKELLEKSL